MNQNYIAFQGNRLVEARHKKPLSSREQKIILTMVSMIKEKDEDFKEYRISIKDFHEMLGLKGDPNYNELKVVVENLMSKTIEIQRENGGWLLTHWVSTAEYVAGEGALRLKFVPELKPYLLDLKNHYTSYKLSNILSLKSTYSIRLYELMKRWEYLGTWTVEVEELKGMMGGSIASFERYNLFKTRALLVAINELNKKTDVFIEFKEIKTGRKVEKIAFSIRKTQELINKLPLPAEEPDKSVRIEELPLPVEEPKKPVRTEEDDIRDRLNKITDGYQFDRTYFEQMYQGASLIWNAEAEKELTMLIHYTNEEESVLNPLGFIKKKLQNAWNDHSHGDSVTFATLKPNLKRSFGREAVIPDWFKKDRKSTNDENVKVTDPKIAEEREKLLKELEE